MSWKAGLKKTKCKDTYECEAYKSKIRYAKDNAVIRIKDYRDLKQYEKVLQKEKMNKDKNWQRDRYHEQEKTKAEEAISKQSSEALLREVLSCNLAVKDLLDGEVEGKWKEFLCQSTEDESLADEFSDITNAGLSNIPSSSAASQFLARSLYDSDPIMFSRLMRTTRNDSGDVRPTPISEGEAALTSRPVSVNRNQSMSSLPGTPMITRPATGDSSSRLVDSVFLTGPKKRDILSLQKGESSDLPQTSIYPVAIGRSDGVPVKKAAVPSPTKRPSSLRSNAESVASSGSISGYSLTPEILYITSKDPDVVTDILPSFCFPNGVDTTVTDAFGGKNPSSSLGNTMPARVETQEQGESIKPKYFVFQLSGNNRSQHGVCMRISRRFGDKTPFSPIVYTSYCLCVITSSPFFLFLFDILAAFLTAGGLDMAEPLDSVGEGMLTELNLKPLLDFSAKLLRQSVPGYGMELRYTVSVKGRNEEVTLIRRQEHEVYASSLDSLINQSDEVTNSVEFCFYTLEWALPVLLSHVPLKEVLFVLGCMLTEMKVIVKCKDIGVLSACVMALLGLIRPLTWSCPYIVILPESLRDYLESPVPLVVGVVTTPLSENAEYLQPTSGTVVIDINLKKVNLDPADVVYSHTLKLPYTDTLLPKLRPFGEAITKLARQKQRSSKVQVKAEVRDSSVKQRIRGEFEQRSSPRHASPRNAAPSLRFPDLDFGSPKGSPTSQRRSLQRTQQTGGIVSSPKIAGSDSPQARRRKSTTQAIKSVHAVAAQNLMKKYSSDSNADCKLVLGDGKLCSFGQENPNSNSGLVSSDQCEVKKSSSLVSDLSEGREAVEVDQSAQLISAVVGFSNCLAGHMTQIADTAIKLSWDNKAVRRQARYDLRNTPVYKRIYELYMCFCVIYFICLARKIVFRRQY